jgi:hypothetical protein
MTISKVRCQNRSFQIGLFHSAPNIQVSTISPHRNGKDPTNPPTQIAQIDINSIRARPKEPTGGGGLVLGVVAVISAVLPPRSAHRQPRPPLRLPPQPRRPQSQRADPTGGGKAGRRRRKGCLGVRQDPPAFRLRAHMSMAAKALVGTGSGRVTGRLLGYGAPSRLPVVEVIT